MKGAKHGEKGQEGEESQEVRKKDSEKNKASS